MTCRQAIRRLGHERKLKREMIRVLAKPMWPGATRAHWVIAGEADERQRLEALDMAVEALRTRRNA